jgi:hypothetical protein
MKSNRFFEGQPLGPNELRRVVQTERAAIMFPCNPFVSQWNITTPQNLNCITFAHFQSLKPLQTSFSVLLLQNDEGPAIFIEHERHFWRVIDSLRYYDPGPDQRPLWKIRKLMRTNVCRSQSLYALNFESLSKWKFQFRFILKCPHWFFLQSH